MNLVFLQLLTHTVLKGKGKRSFVAVYLVLSIHSFHVETTAHFSPNKVNPGDLRSALETWGQEACEQQVQTQEEPMVLSLLHPEMLRYLDTVALHCVTVVVQLLSRVWFLATPCTVARQAPLSSTVSWSLLRFMSVELVMLSSHLILCCSFFFGLLSFPASGSFPVSRFFASCGQSISASVTVLLMNSQCWFLLGLTGLIFLLSKGLSRVFSGTPIQTHHFFGAQPSL